MSKFNFEQVSDETLRVDADYGELFTEVKSKLESLGGKIKKDSASEGILEAAWRYGLNPFGLRVTAQFRTISDKTIELSFSGGFKDAFDTIGAGRKKATEVMNAVMGREVLTCQQEQSAGMPPRIGVDSVLNRGKRKTSAGILALLLGGAGAHKFYLGNWGIGIVYLASCFFIPGISAAVGAIEAIRLFTLNDVAFNEKYNYRNLKPFEVTW